MKKWIRFFHSMENGFLYLLLASLIVLSFVQITGRMVFDKGFSGADEIIYHLLLWLALVGAAIATRENEHITIDIVSRFVSSGIKRKIQGVTSAFSTFVCGILTVAAIRFIMDEIDAETTLLDNTPAWPFEIIIPIAFGIITIRFAYQTILSFTHTRSE